MKQLVAFRSGDWPAVEAAWSRNSLPFVPELLSVALAGLSRAGEALLYEAVPDAAVRWAQVHDSLDVLDASARRIDALKTVAGEEHVAGARARVGSLSEVARTGGPYDRALWITGGHALVNARREIALLAETLRPSGELRVVMIAYVEMTGDPDWQVIWSPPPREESVEQDLSSAIVHAGLELVALEAFECTVSVPSVEALLTVQGLAPKRTRDAVPVRQAPIIARYEAHVVTGRRRMG